MIPSEQDAPQGAVIWLLALFIWAAAHPQRCQGSLRGDQRTILHEEVSLNSVKAEKQGFMPVLCLMLCPR